ncbi:hypothetical protein HC891_02820 [Candidatus Gracilibacteria bacterium]|nr:hypothetical protein [Candidatus Gracilibacteria bacterium]
MTANRELALAEVRQLLTRLHPTWENSDAISETSYLQADLGLQSLDIMILGSSIELPYEQQLRLMDFFVEMANRGQSDATVGELLDFILKMERWGGIFESFRQIVYRCGMEWRSTRLSVQPI